MNRGEAATSVAARAAAVRRRRRPRAGGAPRALLTFAMALAVAFASPGQAAPPPEVRAEVDFLLSTVAGSGCEFYRNGTWYDAKAAAAHLRLKYDALLQRDLIHDSMDFIERAASQSSLSGRPYAIRCAGDAPVSTRQWFGQLLLRHRQQHAQNE